MYLPSFGLALIVASVVVKLGDTYARPLLLVLIALLLVLTYQRNGLWAEPIKLMQSELDANFDKPRIHAFLGNLYRDEGNYSKAAQSFENAFNLVGLESELDNQGYEQRYAYLNNYVANLGRSGQYLKAIDVSSSFIGEVRKSEHRWALTNNLGYLHYDIKDYNECIMHMMSAIGLDPKRHESFVGAGLCFYYLDRKEESLMMFTNGLALAPNPDDVRAIMVTLGLLDS
jgi:tetratricopeptide (TPR) repeat protein